MTQFTSAEQMRIIWWVVVPIMSLPVLLGVGLVLLAVIGR